MVYVDLSLNRLFLKFIENIYVFGMIEFNVGEVFGLVFIVCYFLFFWISDFFYLNRVFFVYFLFFVGRVCFGYDNFVNISRNVRRMVNVRLLLEFSLLFDEVVLFLSV